MEDHRCQAPLITNESTTVHVLYPESNKVEILDDGRSIRDVIDSKIRECSSVGDPELFYVANLDSILERYLQWVTNLPRVKPFYAVKCNNTASAIRMLRALGTGFDCASKAEIQLALSLGATPDQIIYAHTTKPQSHIRYACTRGVDMMTFDSEDELLKISLCHAEAKLVIRIAVDDSKSLVRLSSKFGASLASAGRLLERAKELGLQVIGVSFHVGSGCTGAEAFKQAIADARRVFDIASSLGFQLRLLDIGGGFSEIGDFQQKFEKFSKVINASLDKLFPPDSGVEIIAEPGRYFVESAFTLAVNVTAKRTVVDDEDSSSDRTIMYYINDGVYGSLSCVIFDPAHCQLEPYLHRAVGSAEPRYQSVIWGPTCDCMDKVMERCWMPELHVGDFLLFDNMGAYSVSLFSNFNSFEKAHIFPVVAAKTWRALNLAHSFGNTC
ncbi:ornithine decarboxylase-like [Parambassis ranga]|uniref:Ornithine decarboxylase-like n=1 Tax=Parambassis ranga TaxID=210632 RepID=A0A6P7IP97_9TELE|nr:ornithine decarboxylase-like [Parambassis ranga]